MCANFKSPEQLVYDLCLVGCFLGGLVFLFVCFVFNNLEVRWFLAAVTSHSCPHLVFSSLTASLLSHELFDLTAQTWQESTLK